MCVCNNDDAKYEVIINDNFNNYICTVKFKSITTVCRFLDDANLINANIDVCRIKDSNLLDIDVLLSIWKSDFESED